MSSDQIAALGKEYMHFLKNVPGRLVFEAFDEYLLRDPNSRFPPKAADLYRIIAERTRNTRDAGEAWEQLMGVMSSAEFHYHPRETFMKLPESIRKAVGSWKTLKSWSMTDTEHVNRFIKAEFMRDYRELEGAALIPSGRRLTGESS